jgi:DMSO/TMAO reductase YedYZ molybdopterin-dependent catalytic subunit
MATYVQADASDGYRAIFSLPELDADFQDSEVIVADTMNGAPLDEKTGPFRIVAPHDKRPARWIRMLQSITVVRVAKRFALIAPIVLRCDADGRRTKTSLQPRQYCPAQVDLVTLSRRGNGLSRWLCGLWGGRWLRRFRSRRRLRRRIDCECGSGRGLAPA